MIIIFVWIAYYLIGSPIFNRENAVSIYGTIVQGMSALLSVSIAVIVFRIQSLENRRQSLEQSTLNYIHQIIQWSYPAWSTSVEEDIQNGNITSRYFQRLPPTISFLESSQRERDSQQQRLMNVLTSRNALNKAIQQTRNDVIWSLLLLMSPILLSFVLLLISDAFSESFSFYAVSFVILLSAFGIASLIKTVMDSIPSESQL